MQKVVPARKQERPIAKVASHFSFSLRPIGLPTPQWRDWQVQCVLATYISIVGEDLRNYTNQSLLEQDSCASHRSL